jgi:hypothetical protein
MGILEAYIAQQQNWMGLNCVFKRSGGSTSRKLLCPLQYLSTQEQPG